MTRFLMLWFVSGMLVHAGSAVAQPEGGGVTPPPADEERARKHFDRGKALFVLEDYERAANEYLASYLLTGKPPLLYNIAQAFRLHGDLAKAVKYYEQYLELEPQGRGADNARALIIELRAEMERAAALKKARRASDAGGAGEEGEDAAGEIQASLGLAISADNRVFGVLDERYPGEIEWRWRRWIPWTVLGAGAAVTLSGRFWQWRAATNLNEYEDGLRRDCPTGCFDYPSDARDRAKWQRGLSVGAYATGGAVMVTGLVLAYLNRPRAPQVDPLSASIRVIPSVSPSDASVSVGLCF